MKNTFEQIKTYHKTMGYDYEGMGQGPTMRALRNNCLALHTEVTEVLNCFPWKPWRPDQSQSLNKDHAKEEIADCLFFLGAICEIAGISPAELARAFGIKLAENYSRLRSGYNKPKNEIERGR